MPVYVDMPLVGVWIDRLVVTLYTMVVARRLTSLLALRLPQTPPTEV